MPELDLTPEQRASIAQRKATCPFIGSAVRSGELPVHGTPERPMAAVDDVIALGDTGGGDLGHIVLKIFAIGNHSRLADTAGDFADPTPDGFFSLDFPGSQGAHPGDSRILLEDPERIDSGRLSKEEFERLKSFADERGMLTVAAIGRFIAVNVERDPRSRRLDWKKVLPKFFSIVGAGGEALISKILDQGSAKRSHVEFLEELTAVAPEDNLIGSAGEFGLLFAFLANRPGATDDEIPLSDVEGMFVRMEFPVGWRDWPKRTTDWVEATGEILLAALRASRSASVAR